jgi:hypothetical protein
MTSIGRLHSDKDPAGALRGALASPWPPLRLAARHVIRRACEGCYTFGGLAEKLGIGRRSLERLRKDFPEAFPAEWRSN